MPLPLTVSRSEGALHGMSPQPRLAGGIGEPLLQAEPRRKRRCINMQQGSTWGTVFNMCSATLGAGALSLPY